MRKLQAIKKQKFNNIRGFIEENSVGLEIGVWHGDMMEQVLEKCKPKKYYGVDPWKYQPEYKDRVYGTNDKNQKFLDGVHEFVIERTVKYPEIDINIIRDYSEKITNYVEKNELDWAYIDGNHSYEYVLQDLESCLQLVKTDGLIICDDYNTRKQNDNGGTEKAVKEFTQKNNLTFDIKSGHAIIKVT